MTCFALLDDASATTASSRLYTDYIGTLSCTDAAQFSIFLKDMQRALQQGQHAVALFDYALGEQLHDIAPRATRITGITGISSITSAVDGTTSAPVPVLAQVLLFKTCRTMHADEVAAWLLQQEAESMQSSTAGIANLRDSIDASQFYDDIARIQAYLVAGDAYQVNYTYRLRFDAWGTPAALYHRLRASQPVPYGALIALPDGGAVLSFSPELFIRNDEGTLTARPMKGTAAASGDTTIDAQRAHALAADPKNRAENLMIVDLLRNDLGCIAQTGSVQAPQLFEVHRYGQVLQMTSTITARIDPRADLNLAQLLTALYPCGSITGAPKRRSMQIIRELETEARGLYTGALGWFEAARPAQPMGDFCLSVPIRTLVLAPPKNGVHSGEMGVGAGIVYDSDAAAEYAECQLKARFLTALTQDFSLLETMQASSAGCPHLERHLQRLRASALYFGFAYDEAMLRARVAEACAGMAVGMHRLRLALQQNGGISIQTAPLLPLTQAVRLLLATKPMRADDIFLRHKTTVRATYDAAWREAEAQGAFDMLFQNQAGEITEGARSNLFIKLHGRWLTPPIAAGVLPGVMRAVLLDDPTWQATEATISVADLYAAEELVVCNALRGVLRAVLPSRD